MIYLPIANLYLIAEKSENAVDILIIQYFPSRALNAHRTKATPIERGNSG